MVLDYAWLIIALPLAAFLLTALFGRWGPERGGYLSTLAITASGVLSVLVAWTLWQDHVLPFGGDAFTWSLQDALGQAWLDAGTYVFDLGIYADSLTAWLLVAVGILTAGIAIYSLGYMRPEKDGYHLDDGTHIRIDGRQRYYAALALFVGSMLGFVLGSNLLMMFVFWELMGLCSYLLIGFWYAKPSASAAAQKAFLVTRIGDVFFMAGLIILSVLFGSIDLSVLLDEAMISQVASEHSTPLGLSALFLFIGAIGKSAQLPLHIWLPDAMEGPTTVSALIHAATMVKAGVFLVARFIPIFASVDWVLVTVATVGALTAFVAATMAVANYDIKRVLAFSTISQLGYMFLGLGAVAFAAHGFTTGLLHLLNHAFFKALLFLCAGAVGFAIHSYDMREFGGLAKAMPITAVTMLIATLSISGIPPFSGFWSKDELLASVWEAGTHGSTWFLVLWVIALGTAALTAYYMFRLWFMTFLGDYRGDEDDDHLHDGTGHMNAVLIAFAAITLLTGFSVFFAGETLYFEEALHFDLSHMLAAWQTWVGVGAAVLGVGAAWHRYQPATVEDNLTPEPEISGVEKLLTNRYYWTQAYYAAVDKIVVAGAFLLDAFDRYVIDWFVDAIGETSSFFGGQGSKLQTGRVSDYAVAILSGVLVLTVIIVYVLNYTMGRGI